MTKPIVKVTADHVPPLGGYKPERDYNVEGEWVRGDPSPFGLICFGMTTCMLMFVVTTWSEDASLVPTVAWYALAFGGFGQLIAGVLDLIKGNTFGGTVFSSYGCFWIGWGGFNYTSLIYPDQIVSITKSGQTLYYGLWALLTLIFFISSLRKTASIQTVLSSLVVTFVLLAGGVWNAKCNEAAGYLGAFCAGSALYAAMIILVKIELGYELPGVAPTLYFRHPMDRTPSSSDAGHHEMKETA
ncbi:hypothetical protein CEUSTIGMA_g9507.t1 [Chlamydomonas eustigma]|uniref:GPR1/FUN34/yaaH family protein n=1 Tax=Chlamydomonas eustigma TaxID=1157962 RepID=A0A250XGP2_9CHLO|nr:hypothetical protein CEUSTIGMA_g9507.t1 [Chlamydomonas eustigma]|eukprot:GAX82079.1 hypothetical protein CEUSTIGMA_g9507.t1 [Chlamydomonas eustigma]